MMERLFFMWFRKNLKALLYPAQNAKEFHTKRLYVLMQTPLRFISNALAFEIKRKGVFCLYFSLTFHALVLPVRIFLDNLRLIFFIHT